jgi:hypothetical protein
VVWSCQARRYGKFMRVSHSVKLLDVLRSWHCQHSRVLGFLQACGGKTFFEARENGHWAQTVPFAVIRQRCFAFKQ